VYNFLIQYGGYALASIYLVGGILVFVRSQRCLSAYLKQFPPVNGVPLYMSMYFAVNLHSPEYRAISSAMRKRQHDPDLESMRREYWRKYREFILWVFLFPVPAIGLAALVIAFFPH